MGFAEQRGAAWRAVRSRRSVVGVAVFALLALTTLGGLHAAEHDLRHESSPCEACIAVASPAIVGGIALDLGGQRNVDTLPARPHEDPSAAHSAVRPPARAPPSRPS